MSTCVFYKSIYNIWPPESFCLFFEIHGLRPKIVVKGMLYVLSTRFWLMSSFLKFFQNLETLHKKRDRLGLLSRFGRNYRDHYLLFLLFLKSLVANHVCSNLNWKTIIFVDLVHWKGNWYAALQSIGSRVPKPQSAAHFS